MNAELLMLVAGTGAFLLTLFWVRSREIREKYALLWLLVALCLLLLGIFPQSIMELSKVLHLSYVALVLFVGLVLSYVFGFFVSVSLTRQFRRNVQLAQELALTNWRLEELEKALQKALASGSRSGSVAQLEEEGTGPVTSNPA
jgi:hypothetical protein